MGYSKNPILQSLNNIENRDALMNEDGSEAEWPDAECIVGNPPFLGGSKMLEALGDEYVSRLREIYKGRVPGGADLVTYWFEKARTAISLNKANRAGLVSTNSIRGGSNRKVLERILKTGTIFNAWSDEPWINEGAAVRVSLVCFDGVEKATCAILDGQPVSEIYADLIAPKGGDTGFDLTTAKPLMENRGVSFQGSQKIGPFDIPGEMARKWLTLPTNPNGRPNSDVLKESWNGIDVTRSSRNMWIIDFGTVMKESDASLYEAPFEYILQHVKPEREKNNREAYRKYWWRHGEPRIAMRASLKPLSRYIATPEVAKHRVFAWLTGMILPDKKLIVIARDDETTFGILQSRFHEQWALKVGSWHGVGNDPRYTPTTCFDTFPFPAGLTPNIPAADYADNPHAQAIASAASRLVELRDNWLNPPEWIRREPEVVSGYPDRLLPINEAAAVELKKRTLTNLYNARPAWLSNAHRVLDEAVAAAYGWEADISDDEVLSRLLKLNQERTEGH